MPRKPKPGLPKKIDSIYVNWSEIGPEHLSRQYFLMLTPELPAKVRLVSRPVKFWRLITADQKYRILRREEAEEKAAANAPGLLVRYAINVIDRADGQLKVLEGSESLFIEFRRCYELTGIEPGGNDAFDFRIDMRRSRASTIYRLSYNVQSRTPFTEEEKCAIRSGLIDLSTMFVPSAV